MKNITQIVDILGEHFFISKMDRKELAELNHKLTQFITSLRNQTIEECIGALGEYKAKQYVIEYYLGYNRARQEDREALKKLKL